MLIDPPAVLETIEAIFESPDYSCEGVGGDFVLPGCVQYQHLHQDMGDYLHDPRGQLDFRDMPVTRIQVNYPLVVSPGSQGEGHTVYNGATRQIPGTQNSRQAIPQIDEDEEPLWMKLSVTAPGAECHYLLT